MTFEYFLNSSRVPGPHLGPEIGPDRRRLRFRSSSQQALLRPLWAAVSRFRDSSLDLLKLSLFLGSGWRPRRGVKQCICLGLDGQLAISA
ncbi:unnamed protein product [Protopolystoma xenopodis]|uniref:Uncharacterized protein n=1 Tax=Protopolystoma xenopodis TaxID=117903 RepID=A0A3S5AHU8_9PLAT|nr:unnamed protein product [Protopolystoma xenopodis]